MTYSHLVKPRVRSARRRATFPGAEDGWDPDATLNWSNRGISIKKMGLLQDMLLQNSFLTGLQLAGGRGYWRLAGAWWQVGDCEQKFCWDVEMLLQMQH